mmetsp:Transcript_30939/g.78968  ORF Transcript_30939/g.78968 Transcript_30939/m.78968 type:complete len:222 (+) Transcript_30939:60-725(+)
MICLPHWMASPAMRATASPAAVPSAYPSDPTSIPGCTSAPHFLLAAMAAEVAGPPMHALLAMMTAGRGSLSRRVAVSHSHAQCTPTITVRNAHMASAWPPACCSAAKEPAEQPMMAKNRLMSAPPICDAPAKGDGWPGDARSSLLPAMAQLAATSAVNMRVRLDRPSAPAAHLPAQQEKAIPAMITAMLSAVTPLAPRDTGWLSAAACSLPVSPGLATLDV